MEAITGKELLIRTFKHEKGLPRVPWVPFAGVHAGKLKGYSAIEVLTDGGKLFESLMEVNRLYRPDGQPVLFDLQVEAEILGCELVWAQKAPPSVKSHPLASDKTVPQRLPEKSDGRLPMILEVMKRFKAEVGETTALFGLICGPLTLASHLRGTELFMDMFMDPDYVHQLIRYTSEVAKRMAEYYLEAGMDVIAIVDPLVSQISPQHFAQFISEPAAEIFNFIKQNGSLSSFFVCGNASKNIEEMCKTGPDSIFIDENIDMVEAKKITDRYNIVLGGNIPLTSIMLYGSQQDNMKYVVDLLDKLDHHNLAIAPGCDMPYDVPPENPIGIQQAIRNTDEVRKMLENYQGTQLDIEVELPDYENLEKPLIEVFTLDSATCAACTYMVNAVKIAKEHFGDKIDWVEHKFTTREGIARIKKMGIKNLPCIYINGKLKYSSIIPSRNDLFRSIEECLK
ncbi:uroporphyrinogen decarboxylase [Caldicoprobacter faecalis]|uniref:Uroporphyrinogen decarboxylase n=1 Tax=Caldicoprobacter faecalis TaxID=937334 RepID=A0A1I5X6I1_9FIRM|nr:uroporphyrinogen decarboxylase family protein [Caldicoprobacter faecalis]SFQ27560.1 uroporphyrinogen decarboxylase [Caldicoprobacter faecalis]